MFDQAFGYGCETPLRHALGFGVTLHRRCVINREDARVVAKEMGLFHSQVRSVVRLLTGMKIQPSRERMAVIAMSDWGLTDQDIGEIFLTTTDWAEDCRWRKQEIAAAEPIPAYLLDEVLQTTDPCPRDLYAMARQLRSERPVGRTVYVKTPGCRQYAYVRSAFVQLCPG